MVVCDLGLQQVTDFVQLQRVLFGHKTLFRITTKCNKMTGLTEVDYNKINQLNGPER